ncbi:hypothetical protein IMCC20628_02593 [Hoeflea sp. IMCC20628]|uniref:hypothetical protein n=1 Tax=Hoeflea sp. IMCC20628 TaxID=1620421 RepID=UPI00063AFB30|nr:hypothetical protein [Hoeflea sp. IMCC20628]AKI01291.1 hypothetical protein IMCC20628_02593 [Hoeflea sp. IMCC20628]
MLEFEVPLSMKEYINNKRVRSAVDDLVGKLDGDDMIECDWSEAREYNQALLFAAQVRTDFVEMFYRVWEATFGVNNASRLGDGFFDYSNSSPSDVWEHKCIEIDYYRDKNKKNEGRSDCLILMLVDEEICLHVYRFLDNDSMVSLGAAADVEGWVVEQEGRGDILANSRVKMTDFIADPDQVIRRFSDDAKRIIEALLKD